MWHKRLVETRQRLAAADSVHTAAELVSLELGSLYGGGTASDRDDREVGAWGQLGYGNSDTNVADVISFYEYSPALLWF